MKYRTKPVTIEAIQWTGDNLLEVLDFVKVIKDKPMFLNNSDKGDFYEILIPTLEGTMCAKVGDYIIKGLKGEFYPCKSDIFEMKYEKVED